MDTEEILDTSGQKKEDPAITSPPSSVEEDMRNYFEMLAARRRAWDTLSTSSPKKEAPEGGE